jgi:outer membrane lipoprotein SlyB
VRRWRNFKARVQRDWQPVVCCGGGGALGAMFGWSVGHGSHGAIGICAGAGAVLGAFFYALIE